MNRNSLKRAIQNLYRQSQQIYAERVLDQIGNRLDAIEGWISYEKARKLSSTHEAVNSNAPETLTSKDFWELNTVVGSRVFEESEDSLDALQHRFLNYPGYRELMDMGDLSGKTFVDYGCGPGHDLIHESLKSENVKIIGMDISKSALSIARERVKLHGLDVSLVEVEEDQRIPLESGTVDAILCTGVLMCSENPTKLLEEFRRILKDTGFIKLMVYNKSSLWYHLYCGYVLGIGESVYSDLSTEEIFARSTDGLDIPVNRCWTPEEVVEMAETAGLECEFLGAAPSVFEMEIAIRRFEALRYTSLNSTHREFLSNILVREDGVPYSRDGAVAGIDACFKLNIPEKRTGQMRGPNLGSGSASLSGLEN